MTEPTRKEILSAVRVVADVDGPRRGFLRALLERAEPSDREIRAAWFVMRGYRQELENAGIDYDKLVPPEDLDGLSGKAPVEAVLEASGNSIIVVRNWTDEQAAKLRSWLGMGYLWSALIVSLKDNQTIEMLSEEKMRDAGWIRIEKAKKFVQESS